MANPLAKTPVAGWRENLEESWFSVFPHASARQKDPDFPAAELIAKLREALPELDAYTQQQLYYLSQLKEPEFFWPQLLGFAESSQFREKPDLAYSTYQFLASANAAEPPKLLQAPAFIRLKANSHLEAMQGKGAWGRRLEFLAEKLPKQILDLSTLGSLAVAGFGFQWFRFKAMSMLTDLPAHPLTRGIAARSFASLAGLAFEAPAFPMAAKGIDALLGRPVEFSHLPQEIASSFFFLGGIKFMGWGAGALFNRVHGVNLAAGWTPNLKSINRYTRPLYTHAGMFLGSLMGHHAGIWAGVSPSVNGATTLTDSILMFLQYGIAGSFLRKAFPHLHRKEMFLDQETRKISQNKTGNLIATGLFAFQKLRPAIENFGGNFNLMSENLKGKDGGEWSKAPSILDQGPSVQSLSKKIHREILSIEDDMGRALSLAYLGWSLRRLDYPEGWDYLAQANQAMWGSHPDSPLSEYQFKTIFSLERRLESPPRLELPKDMKGNQALLRFAEQGRWKEALVFLDGLETTPPQKRALVLAYLVNQGAPPNLASSKVAESFDMHVKILTSEMQWFKNNAESIYGNRASDFFADMIQAYGYLIYIQRSIGLAQEALQTLEASKNWVKELFDRYPPFRAPVDNHGLEFETFSPLEPFSSKEEAFEFLNHASKEILKKPVSEIVQEGPEYNKPFTIWKHVTELHLDRAIDEAIYSKMDPLVEKELALDRAQNLAYLVRFANETNQIRLLNPKIESEYDLELGASKNLQIPKIKQLKIESQKNSPVALLKLESFSQTGNPIAQKYWETLNTKVISLNEESSYQGVFSDGDFYMALSGKGRIPLPKKNGEQVLIYLPGTKKVEEGGHFTSPMVLIRRTINGHQIVATAGNAKIPKDSHLSPGDRIHLGKLSLVFAEIDRQLELD